MQNWFMIATTHIANCRFEDALQNIDRAIEQKPENAMAHCIRGIALKSLHRPAEALDSYRMALSVDPSNLIAANDLGILLYHLGQPAKAMEVLESAISGDPHR